MSWARLRQSVKERDGDYCRVCGMKVGKHWDLGHLQDRIVGGEDTLDNLAVMCQSCNRVRKPIHRERGEALEWMAEQHHPAPVNWRPAWDLWTGKAPTNEQAPLAEH